MCAIEDIYIQWEGPLNIEDLKNLQDEKKNYGVYQIYGNHPAYGDGVLLYIGKADQQQLGTRIPQHNLEDWTSDPNKLEVYIGRLLGHDTPSDEEWSKMIAVAEAILIYAHAPAYNSSGLNDVKKDIENYQIFNFGAFRQLAPDCSGKRWTSSPDIKKNMKPFETSR